MFSWVVFLKVFSSVSLNTNNKIQFNKLHFSSYLKLNVFWCKNTQLINSQWKYQNKNGISGFLKNFFLVPENGRYFTSSLVPARIVQLYNYNQMSHIIIHDLTGIDLFVVLLISRTSAYTSTVVRGTSATSDTNGSILCSNTLYF